MRYIQAEEIKSIAFLIVACIMYSTIYFIYDNKLLINLYFGRKKSIIKLKGKGKELIETRVRFLIQKSPLDKKIYTLLEINGQIYHLANAKVFGEFDYKPIRASVMFKNGEVRAVALEDKSVYNSLFNDYMRTSKRIFTTTIVTVILWKILLLSM